MEVIYRERGSGKTTDLIKMSAETGYVIVTGDVKEIERMARRMELSIPTPIPFSTFLNGRLPGRGMTGILIDNVDLLLHSIARVHIMAITLSKNKGDQIGNYN